jgi:pyruvate,orthophosphate dikinase
MSVAQGILTATGGMTSHAAVVGRQMGKPSVVGCGALSIDAKAKTMGVGGKVVREGDAISIDGATGEVILKQLPTSPSEVLQVVAGKKKPESSPIYQKFVKLLGWADEVRRLGIRANATSRATPRSRSRSARAASACAAPSTCSSPRTGWRSW